MPRPITPQKSVSDKSHDHSTRTNATDNTLRLEQNLSFVVRGKIAEGAKDIKDPCESRFADEE